ncbi:carbohydrate porin [Agarivorans aestuarii]|uniref:Carbohydrate porin n=1 Tax=Agarivorans aestuarii TaxID=1563703 RepID=A0ABU7G299_9ALTE|nr:carbohydrate porin [Agarivorans aestuarii]MEE1673533.1 carbohydrate porin [Agarivorans aestuarii]
MKLSKLSLACLAAVSSLSLSGGANASTEGFEFHGYFRAGLLTSAENDFKKANFAGQKETLGRLGLEADNDASLNFANTWGFDDGRSVKVNVGLGDYGQESSLSASADAFQMGFGQLFIEFDGMSSSGIFWGGKREYGKDNYIFMTDFFYSDMSGTGVGITGYEVGDALLDFAYIASDRVDPTIDRWATDDAGNLENLNNIMHAFQFGVTYGALELSAMYKTMPDNWDYDGKEWAETGYDLTAIYTLNSFFGIPGNGFSKIIAQAGKGLGSGNLLAGTITSYNAYHPGSQFQGEHPDWTWSSASAGGDANRLLTMVDEKDTSARLLLWGGYTLDNGIGFFPSIQGQYNDHHENDLGSYDYWISAMVRPTFPVSDHFYVQGELGYVHNNWSGATSNQSKITVAPTFILPTGMGPAPEIRLLATYLPKSWTHTNESGESDSDFILGFQADVWW